MERRSEYKGADKATVSDACSVGADLRVCPGGLRVCPGGLRVCPGVGFHATTGADLRVCPGGLRVCPGVDFHATTGADTQVCPYVDFRVAPGLAAERTGVMRTRRRK